MVEAHIKSKAAAALVKSHALQVIFEFFDYSEQIKMQGLNKRFYKVFTPGMVKRVSLFNIGNVGMGIVVFPDQEYVHVLAPTSKPDSLCKWVEVPFELSPETELKGLPLREIRARNVLRWPLWPKIVQVNKTDVHILGGRVNLRSSDLHFMTAIDPSKLDRTLQVHRRANLPTERVTFAVCVVNSFIYIGGGYNYQQQNTDRVDRYSLLNDEWEQICRLPFAINSHSFITVRNRYIYSIGNEIPKELAVPKCEVVFRLDTYNP
jgi:hypothetical protein